MFPGETRIWGRLCHVFSFGSVPAAALRKRSGKARRLRAVLPEKPLPVFKAGRWPARIPFGPKETREKGWPIHRAVPFPFSRSLGAMKKAPPPNRRQGFPTLLRNSRNLPRFPLSPHHQAQGSQAQQAQPPPSLPSGDRWVFRRSSRIQCSVRPFRGLGADSSHSRAFDTFIRIMQPIHHQFPVGAYMERRVAAVPPLTSSLFTLTLERKMAQ